MGRIPALDAALWAWPDQVSPVAGGVCAPAGVSAAGVAAGIKKSGKPDLALIVAEGTAAGVFTTNAFAAPCVGLTRAHVARGSLKGIVINSGNANACTGPAGFDDAVAMAERVAGHLGCSPYDIGVASTGVIGVPMPMDAVLGGIDTALAAASREGGAAAAEAIMTTDTFSKEISVEVALGSGTVRIGGAAKGSGMIRPDMATMLAFVTTDAELMPDQAQVLVRAAAEPTFGRISVDGETSTNDMLLLIATGVGAPVEAGSPDEDVFAAALDAVCAFLAEQIVRDGEGATKFVTIAVGGGADSADALRAAFAVAHSPLLKCALFGEDPNWGRVLCAIGASGAALDPDRTSARFGPHLVASGGARADVDEAALDEYLRAVQIEISVDLGLGDGSATVLTTDLSYDYVRINAEYRT